MGFPVSRLKKIKLPPDSASCLPNLGPGSVVDVDLRGSVPLGDHRGSVLGDHRGWVPHGDLPAPDPRALHPVLWRRFGGNIGTLSRQFEEMFMD